MNEISISISDRAGSRIEAGHLWIFSNEVQRDPGNIEPGSFCRFMASGRVVGWGYYNSHSLIAGRILSRESVDDVATLVESRLKRAFAQRKPLGANDAARLV